MRYLSHECLRAIHSSTGRHIPAGSGSTVAGRRGLLFFAGGAVAESGFPHYFCQRARTGCRSADRSVIARRAARAPLCANRRRI